MKRLELLGALKMAAPALSKKGLIPVFTCFCFHDKTVTAFNDTLAIRVPCSLEMEGCIDGDTLLKFIRASKAGKVEIVEVKKKNVRMKFGRSRVRWPFYPVKDFLFEPETEGEEAHRFKVKDKFMRALEAALISPGTNPAAPNRMGVTMVFEENGIVLYSTDGISMTRVRVNMKFKLPRKILKRPVMMDTVFVQALVDHHRVDKIKYLGITEDTVEAWSQEGVWFYIRQRLDAEPKVFTDVFREHRNRARFMAPKGFDRALQRAIVLIDAGGGRDVRLSLRDGRVYLKTETLAGDVKDVLRHGSMKREEPKDIVVMVDPKRTAVALTADLGPVMSVDKCIWIEGSSDKQLKVDHLISIVPVIKG